MAEATKIILSAVDQTGAAVASVKKGLGSLNESVGSLNQVLGGMVSALSVGAFAGFIKGTIDAADNMNDLSQKVGIGIKDLATWKLAADQSGTSLESVAKGVKGLSGYMVEHGAKLRAAGISATEANGAMVQLADLFKAMPDGVRKTTLAVQLFGKSGMDMIPMLNLGSKGLAEAQAKAAAYGKTLAELAPQADEFNDMMAELAVNSQAAGMNITSYFLPGLIGMSQWLNDIARGGEKAQTAVEWLLGERAMKAMVLAGHPMLVGTGTRSVSGKIGGGAAKGMTLAEEMAMAERNLAGMTAMGLLDKDGKAAKAGKPELYGPDLPYYVAASLKEEARTQAFIDQHEARLEMYRIETEGEESVREAMEKTTAEAAKESWKASQDAAKKAAEEATKSWENFTRDIEGSLTDALMRSFEAGDSFGEAFADNLKNIFKTMILKAAVQITVGTVSGAVQQAMGVSFGGSGGGGGSLGSLGNLLSTGQSLYGAFTGATASSLGGLIGGSFGAGMQGASLAAGLAGPTTAGAGGALGAGATFASALPWIGGALAIASLFGGKLFGGKESPPEAYINQYRSSNISAGSRAYLNNINGLGMGTDTPFGYLAFATQHMDGDAVGRNVEYTNQYLKPVSEADKLVAALLSQSEIGKVSGAFSDEVWNLGGNPNSADGALMRRFARISNAIGGWVDKLADSTEGTLQESYTELVQLLSIRGQPEMEKLANDMFAALGKWDYQRFTSLQAGVAGFNDMFKTDAERFADYSEAMHKAFDDLNIAFPESRDGFKALVEGIDTSTKAGFDLYVTLLDLSPTMAAYYDALNQELDVKKQLAAAMNENAFSSAVDYRRYQGVAANYDATLAGDYAYNIRLGAIKPGAAANGDLVGELRALRSDLAAQNLAIATNTQDTAKLLRRWNGDGMPETRVVA